MRWTVARGATVAGVLPAAFLVALLVGAPFAGTTTTPLIADRAATATGSTPTGAASYGAASYDATTAAGDGAVDDAASTPAPGVQVPRGSMLTLVVSWLTLAFVGLAVLLAAARGAHRRLAYPPAWGSGSSGTDSSRRA